MKIELDKPLTIEQIEFRVQSVNKGGYATILAYKDARVDMERLDEAVGPLNWMRTHSRDNANCTVSIWDDSKAQWVGKEDTGTESAAEAQKGLASDSFKRACFNWGIGRELYGYPRIQVELKKDEWKLDEKDKDRWGQPKPKATWKLQPRSWIWFSQFEGGELSYLAAKDENVLRFKWGKYTNYDLKKAIVANQVSITAIKNNITEGNFSSAAENFYELDQATQDALWVAPTKGGPFTTEEIKIMKSTAFREAYYGDKS